MTDATEIVLQDLRYAGRALRSNRTLTITAIAVLTLGIGASGTIYSVLRPMAFAALPFDRPERLMFIGEVSPGGRPEAIAPANFIDLASQSRTFEGVAMYRGTRVVLTGGSVPESLVGANVSGTFFSILRVRAQLGRVFVPADEQSRAVHAAMLSHSCWTRHFSADSAIVGRTITIDGVDRTIVGVLPPGFSLYDTDVWIAGFDAGALSSRVTHNAGALGRLAEGASLAQAMAELETIGRRLALAYPTTNAGWTFRAMPLHEAWLGNYRPAAVTLLAAVALVLLIACCNLANLLLERAVARDREILIRLALGATRRRIAGQMLAESVLLALLGGAGGVVTAFWFVPLVVRLIPANTLTQIPGGAAAVHVDLHTVAVFTVVSTVAGAIVGLAPVARLAHADRQGALAAIGRDSSGGRQGHLWRRVLVVGQVALSVILLASATLMIQSVGRLLRLDRGYDALNALSLALLLPPNRYPEPGQRDAFFASVIERTRALPGVTDVGGVTLISARGRAFAIDRDPSVPREAAPTAVYRAATPDYLATIGIPLVRGRHFTAADSPTAPGVAIVNQMLARSFWPNDDPIGRRLRVLGPPTDVWLTVIGVAGDVKEALDPRSPLQLDPRPTIYRPASQEQVSSMTLVLRTGPDPLSLAETVRREIAGVDPTIPVLLLQSVQQGLRESMATPRFNAAMLSGFATLALLLTTIGVYGVMAYSVSQRTREIGIRMALGATPGRLQVVILREGMILALSGIVCGLVGATGAARLIAHDLYGVGATDPIALVVVVGVIAVVTMVASVIPARRAAGLDPLAALRHD